MLGLWVMRIGGRFALTEMLVVWMALRMVRVNSVLSYSQSIYIHSWTASSILIFITMYLSLLNSPMWIKPQTAGDQSKAHSTSQSTTSPHQEQPKRAPPTLLDKDLWGIISTVQVSMLKLVRPAVTWTYFPTLSFYEFCKFSQQKSHPIRSSRQCYYQNAVWASPSSAFHRLCRVVFMSIVWSPNNLSYGSSS